MELRVILADDDDLFREELAKIIAAIQGIDLLYCASNGDELLQNTRKMKPHAVITDIRMPKMSGIEAAKNIRDEFPDMDIIFITSHEDVSYLKDAIKIYAVDYIEKSIHDDRLIETMERLKKKYRTGGSILQFKTNGGIRNVCVDDLYMAEAFRKKITIYTDIESFIADHSLKELEEELADRIFFKTGKSHIVNITKLESVVSASRKTFEISFKGKNFKAFLSKDLLDELRDRFEELSL